MNQSTTQPTAEARKKAYEDLLETQQYAVLFACFRYTDEDGKENIAFAKRSEAEGDYFALRYCAELDHVLVNGVDHYSKKAKKLVHHTADAFRYRPSEGLLVAFDCDRHGKDRNGNEADGVANFLELLRQLGEKPSNVYVETPRNGIHYIYKYAPRTPFEKDFAKSETPCPGVDVVRDTYLNAPGSYKNGKFYVLRGRYEDAPELPESLLNLVKKREEPKRPPAEAKTSRSLFQGTTTKKEYTADELLDFVRRDRGDAGHHEIELAFAWRLKNGGFTRAEAEKAITATPEHFARKDTRDLDYILGSVYGD